jgi:hypothetical protein
MCGHGKPPEVLGELHIPTPGDSQLQPPPSVVAEPASPHSPAKEALAALRTSKSGMSPLKEGSPLSATAARRSRDAAEEDAIKEGAWRKSERVSSNGPPRPRSVS